MSETLLVAIISGAFVGIPSVIATVMSNNKSNALMNYRLDQIEAKQDKYNNVIARTFELEKKAVGFEEQMKVANHRIKDLEDKE